MIIDTTSLSLYFLTIFLILSIYIIEKLYPSNTKKRSGFDSISGKPYSQTDTPNHQTESKPIHPKLLEKILSSYSEYGIHVSTEHIEQLKQLNTPNQVHSFIETHYINKQ